MEKEYRTEDGYLYVDESHKDVKSNWVSTSRFIWAMSIVTFLTFAFAGCYNLYKHSYSKPDVVVPENTKYAPKYK